MGLLTEGGRRSRSVEPIQQREELRDPAAEREREGIRAGVASSFSQCLHADTVTWHVTHVKTSVSSKLVSFLLSSVAIL